MDLYGLAYECPNRRRKDNCPFKEIDSLSFGEKVDWIDGLSGARRKSIWEHHVDCSFFIENENDIKRRKC